MSLPQAQSGSATPRCVHFGVCGGCQYQDRSQAAQQELKNAQVLDLLGRAGLRELPPITVHTGPDGYEYRNRIRLRLSAEGGTIRLGYTLPGSAEMLPVTMCPIAAPGLWRAAETIVETAANVPQVQRLLAMSVEVELFSTADETKLQATFYIRGKVDPKLDFTRCGEALKAVLPQLTGTGLMLLARDSGGTGRRTERPKALAAWGAAGLMYPVGEDTIWVSRGGFFQVNRLLIPRLVELVTGGHSGQLAWDLFAGAGLFARTLSRSFEQVIAVEAGDIAARDLIAGIKGLPVRAVQATTLDFLQATVIQRERPDLIVLDPPRAGLGADVCGLLVRIKSPRMVYVSCDPASLARDLAVLVPGGYKVRTLDRIDMFPQTLHIETVVGLAYEPA